MAILLPLLPSQLLSQQWQLGLLALLPVMLLSLVVVLAKSSSAKGRLNLPPGPSQLPVLGNLHQLGPLPHRNLRELAQRHGSVMLLRLGTVPTVVVSSAEAARGVMKVHDADCCSRPVSPGPKRLSYDLKNVAFAPYGEYWREMRKLFIVELLSMRRVKAAWYAREQQVIFNLRAPIMIIARLINSSIVAFNPTNIMSYQVDKLLCNLRRVGPNMPVALNEHIFGLADGIIGAVAFGDIYGTERFAHKERFQHVLDEAMDMMASFSAEDFFPNFAGRLVDRLTGLVAQRERIFRELDAFFEMVIDQHMDPKPDNNGCGDLVDVLIDLWKKHRGTLRFTREHVKGIILV
jgi:4-hydroxyphenylacetaldehyde oxime monooxygenase